MSATAAPLGALESLPLRPVTPAGLLAARVGALRARLEARGGLEDDLADELREVGELAAGLEPYLSACTTPESPALAALARRTRAEDWSRRPGAPLEGEMLSGHVEGQVLKLLVHLARARRALDVGMFTGYSALAMAEGLPEGGEVVALEVDPWVARFARRCFDDSPVGHRIAVRVGPALEELRHLAAAGQVFDVVFIDADKAGYAGYLDAVLDGGLLAESGLVCVDNTLMQGEPYGAGEMSANGRAIAAFNDRLRDDPRVEQVLLPLRDGLTLVRRAGDG